MERTTQPLIFLDTHIAVWLYDGLSDRFSPKAKKLINEAAVFISPIVRLELQYLKEINRISDSADVIFETLNQSIGLEIADSNFQKVVTVALSFDWTRDPFDRLIAAEAQLNNAYLITADKRIQKNYSLTAV